MALHDTIHIKGLSSLGQFMEQLAPKLRDNVLRAALRQGAKVVKEAAVANCPVGEPSRKGKRVYGGYAGALRDSLRYDAKVDLRRGQVVAYVRAGGKARGKKADTFYAAFVEFGTAPHGNHPGATPKPYMRPALDAESERALQVIANFIRHRLETKHGIDTKDIFTGGEE